jgi:ABC-2 type transport system permease protein
MLNQSLSVAGRVVRQIVHDRRFLALSLIAPVLMIYMLYLFFAAVRRPFFNPAEFVPPVAAFMVHFLTYITCAIVLVRERTQETLTRMFVSGYTRAAIIGGYLLAYSLIAFLQTLLVLIELIWLYQLGYNAGELLRFAIVIWLLAIISIALAILISNFARNEGQVVPTIPLVLVPSVFFSGMIVAADLLPNWINWLRYTSPMYYATNIIKTLSDGWGSVPPLLAYGMVVLVVAIFTLREQN